MSDPEKELERIQREIDQTWEESKHLARTSGSASKSPVSSQGDSAGESVKQKSWEGSSKWLILLPLAIAMILFYARRSSPQSQNNMMWAAIGFSAGVMTTKVMSGISNSR